MKMKKILTKIVLGLLVHAAVLTNSSFAQVDEPPTEHCYYLHLKGAIDRNLKARATYSRLTQGRSDGIFKFLLISDTMSDKIAARYYDMRANYFHQHGMSIICDELFPLVIPEFKEHVEIPKDAPEFQLMHGGKIAKEIKRAIKNEGWNGAVRVASEELDKIKDQPYFHCLMHNELTEIRKIAILAPIHMAKAKDMGIKSPESISKMLMHSELSILWLVDRIDQHAYPLQREGVPMLCQDFPGWKLPNASNQ